MVREVVDGMYWLQACSSDRSDRLDPNNHPEWYVPGRAIHAPLNAGLFVDDRTLLFDSYSPADSEQLMAELDELLGDRPLDYVVASHPDIPHAGNVGKVMQRYPDVELVAPRYGSCHGLYALESATLVGEGDAIDLGDRFQVAFHEAPFMDAPVHMWMSEASTNTLFTVDWLGFPHLGSECCKFDDEMETPLSPMRLYEFHRGPMFWLNYVDPEKTDRVIDGLIETFEPDVLFPAHGLVVRDEPIEAMEMMKDVIRQMAVHEDTHQKLVGA